MPAKKDKMSQTEQSALFRKVVRDLEDAGALNPTEEAERRFEEVLKRAHKAQASLEHIHSILPKLK